MKSFQGTLECLKSLQGTLECLKSKLLVAKAKYISLLHQHKIIIISSMFVQLFEEGILTLLFLKSVVCIEMYVWDAGQPEPKKNHSYSVSSVTDDTVWHRQALLRLSKCSNTPTKLDAFPFEFVSETISGAETKRQTERFYMVQTMASASSRIGSFATTASKEHDIHLMPWASVATCISDNSPINNWTKRTSQPFL